MLSSITLSSKTWEPLKRLLILDGSVLAHRAYNAVCKDLVDCETGRPTGAAYGFAKSLLKIHKHLPSDYAVISFDHAEQLWPDCVANEPQSGMCKGQALRPSRRGLHSLYKAQRRKPPEDFLLQFEQIWKICQDAGLRCVAPPQNCEGDDVIASFASLGQQAGLDSLILTVDKDLMQLVTDQLPRVQWASPNDLGTLWGEREVCQFLRVARPHQLVDLLALAGDPVDGIQGIPSIGRRIAAELLEACGSLEAVLAMACLASLTDDPKVPLMRKKIGVGSHRLEAICEHAEEAATFKELVLLRCDLVVPPLEALRWEPPPNLHGLLADKHGFPSLAHDDWLEDGAEPGLAAMT